MTPPDGGLVPPDERGAVNPHGTIDDRRPERTRLVVIALLVMLLVGGAAAVAAVFASKRASNNTHIIKAQAEGRREAIKLFCAVEEALIAAGRSTIENSAVRNGRTPADSDIVARDASGSITQLEDGRLSKNLTKLGGPTAAQRLARSKSAASAYEDIIARAVVESVGRPDLLVRDGTTTLDCTKVLTVTKAGG